MTADELRKAQASYERASNKCSTALTSRNTAIVHAILAGWTHAQIAKATGLTRGRIGQLARFVLTDGTSTSRRNEDTPTTRVRGQ